MSETKEYTIWNTPLSVLLRGKIGPGESGPHIRVPSARELIRSSALPANIKSLLEQVSRKTHLWSSEKREIAEELIVHFQDGLDAGRSSDDLIKSFGDPVAAAKLMRRAKKRNRPIIWKTFVFACKSFVLLIGIYIAAALLLALREPNIATDYVAKLNQHISGIPAGQSGRSLYLEAWKDPIFRQSLDVLYTRDADGNSTRIAAHPGQPDWPKAHAFLAANAKVIETLRAAAAMPAMGFPAKFSGDFTEAEAEALGTQPSAGAVPNLEPKAPPLFAVVLPHLARIRQSGELLSSDMLDAADARDSKRTIADYIAIMRMASQVREQLIYVNQLVAVGLATLADSRLGEVNAAYPHLLDGERVALLHRMSGNPSLYVPDLTGERMAMDDMIQRIYSDDGHGDGRITLRGIRELLQAGGDRRRTDAIGFRESLDVAALPAASALMAGRADLTAQVNRFYDLAASDAGMPLWERHTKARMDKAVLELKNDTMNLVRYPLLIIMLPALDRGMEFMDTARAQHEALMAVLALDVYRDKVGHYPAALAELAPQYLPAVPTDLSSGQALRYKLVDGKPLLYGLGWDGKDDGGIRTDTKTQYPRVPNTGDWVLYPPPPEE